MKAEFTVTEDHIKFTTQRNGDIVIMTNIQMTASNAANLANLINSQTSLKVVVKDQTEG